MLTDDQIDKVWKNMLAAETRSLYFGDLTVRYTRRKQWITGTSFFLSSGAAAAVIGKSPGYVPAALSVVFALATAYSMAINLDGRVKTMAKLHSSWSRIASDYDALWNHAYDEDSEDRFNGIIGREREASELAATDAPNDQKLLAKWEDRVLELHALKEQSA